MSTPINQNQPMGIGGENKGLFNRFLRNVSKFGMKYDDMILRNTVGIGINEDPNAQGSSSYDFFSSRAIAGILSKKSIPYLNKGHKDKMRILGEYSIKDEIRDFVSRIADEAIVYNDDSDFCSPKILSHDYPQDIRDKYQEYFEKIYNRFEFSNGIKAWNLMKKFLIYGYLTIEIVWDDKKQNIIHFQEIESDTIIPSYDLSIGKIWIQNPEDPQKRRIFLDSQLMHISYSTQDEFSETSYVEGLIKPYNQLKIIEQTRIMFNIINATVYQKFVIPVKGLSRQKTEEQIGELIANYSEEVEWDDTLGTLSINGSKHLPYNKQLWFPEGEQGTPSVELVSPEGHNLNESDMLTWFYNALKRASKIPFQRFERDNGGGNIFSDASEMTRDESTFGNFIGRLRANFKEIIVKPLKLQMCMEFPELLDDEVFLNQIDISFNSNQIFEKWKKLANTEKEANTISALLSLQVNDKPYFNINYLIEDYVGLLTPEEIEKNKSYWLKDKESGNAEGGDGGDDFGGGDDDFGGGDNDFGGGDDDFGGNDGGGDMGGNDNGPDLGGGGDDGPAPPDAGGDSGVGSEFEF